MNPNFWKQVLFSLLYTFVGLICAIILLIYGILFTPIYLYRWILTKFIAPRFQPNICKAVTVSGHFIATEFLDGDTPSELAPGSTKLVRSSSTTSRCTIITNVFCVGTIKLEDLSRLISEGWLSLKPGESELLYPEFQQYIEMWMGYMFWKRDISFELKNHLHLHVIPEDAEITESEVYLQSLVESLVDKRFPPKKSPWEVHLVQNYQNSEISIKSGRNTNEKMTVLTFRFHHALVDGFSIMNAIVEGLVGRELTSVRIASPRKLRVEDLPQGQSCQVFMSARRFCRKAFYVPWKCCHDMGYSTMLLWRFRYASKSPWCATDKAKKWEMIYKKSELISVDKIKFIKDQFNVSFTTVLLSCLGAAAAQNYTHKGYLGTPVLPMATVVPLKNHPKKLRNHTTATVLEINVTPNLDVIERLNITENQFVNARHFSQIPFLTWSVSRLSSSTIAPLAKLMGYNSLIPSGLTNFPGPGIHLDFLGNEIVALDFTAAGLSGVCGVTFSVISYGKFIRIAVLADKGVMERSELEQMMNVIHLEIEMLYERAMQRDNNSSKVDESGKDLIRANFLQTKNVS